MDPVCGALEKSFFEQLPGSSCRWSCALLGGGLFSVRGSAHACHASSAQLLPGILEFALGHTGSLDWERACCARKAATKVILDITRVMQSSSLNLWL